MTCADMLDGQALAASVRRQGLLLGHPLSFVDETTSTNADAVVAANAGAPHGALFLADRQTGGRGRMGRTWFSPPCANLYASIVLRPSIPAEGMPAITLAVGLGVADTVADLVSNSKVRLKWPNDVLVSGKKVAGILLEGAMRQDRCEHVIVGIGLNVLQRRFDPSIAPFATSLANETERVSNRGDVLLSLLARLQERISSFEHGGLSSMMGAIEARDATLGRAVRVGDRVGVADGIEADGRLRVKIGGVVQRLNAGEVEILPR